MTPRRFAAAAAGLLLVAGCKGVTYDAPPAQPTTSTTTAPTTTTTQATTTTAEDGVDLTDNPPRATTITRVLDGDTVEIADGRKVRLIGIDTPEVYGGIECGGADASAALKTILPAGTRVLLVPDVTDADRFGRLLRYVETVDGADVGASMVAQGHAESTGLRYKPDVARADRYDRLQTQAQAARLGMWAVCR